MSRLLIAFAALFCVGCSDELKPLRTFHIERRYGAPVDMPGDFVRPLAGGCVAILNGHHWTEPTIAGIICGEVSAVTSRSNQ